MLNGGKFDSSMKNQLWAEAANTATMLQNNLVSMQGVQSLFHQFFENILAKIHRFGEIFNVASHSTIKNKLHNHGKHCIWLGFADNHASNCYRLLNPQTN